MDEATDTFLFLDGDGKTQTLPKSYDIREIYPECTQPISHQRKCNSCWAFVVSQMLSYKLCIGTKGKVKVTLSPQELISCDMANNGCDNSKATKAWDYLTNTGVVTDECLPYTSANGVRGECPFLGEAKTCKAGV
jgi:hypothetical protein